MLSSFSRRASRQLRRWVAQARGQPSLLDARVWSTPDPAHSRGSVPPRPDSGLDPELVPILGEFAWHSLTLDPTLEDVSESHYAAVARLLAEEQRGAPRHARALEVAAYAHTTGYLLYQRLGIRTDLFDISPSTLRLGRRLARERNLPIEGTTCVAGDFHQLPYADDQFDLVYICSALHHTWRWREVIDEMVRVLAPGGLLLLDNEPCRRTFCHYLFRANRSGRSDFEQTLERSGILRTVAEPFPGTRPEALFGMVENQTIPIAQLCGALATACDPVAVAIKPEDCMGELEDALVARRFEGRSDSAHWLAGEMNRRIDAARPAMTEADRGMGFALPSKAEIDTLCASAVATLANLPDDPRAADFRFGLADLFGASVHIAVRKKGRSKAEPSARLSQPYPADDIVYAFPPRIARLLDPRGRRLPDIQSSSTEVLGDVFPPGDWTVSVSPDGLRAMTPATDEPRILVPVAEEPGLLLVLLRLHVVVDGQPYRVILCADDEELASFDAYRTDSLLLNPIVRAAQHASALRLSIRTRDLGGTAGRPGSRIFNISYAGGFPLPPPETDALGAR